jgi:hypothetical protein
MTYLNLMPLPGMMEPYVNSPINLYVVVLVQLSTEIILSFILTGATKNYELVAVTFSIH